MKSDSFRAKSPSRTVAAGAVAALATSLFAATVGSAPASATTEYATGTYVALGDSFTAGPGIPESVPDTGICARSNHNYPSLIAKEIKPATFKDVSCSAAVTDNMENPQAGVPPQFDALDNNTELVTVGIGGNDVGFAGIVATCVGLAATNPDGKPCTEHYNQGGVDQLEKTFAETAPKIGAVLQGIHKRAPNAKVVLVGYVSIQPEKKSDCAPGNPNAEMVAVKDLPYLSAKEKSFRDVLSEQAAQNDAIFVDSYAASVGHSACQAPGVRWIEGILNIQGAVAVHPNALGMENVAGLVLDKVNA